jgi:hypothetical protein
MSGPTVLFSDEDSFVDHAMRKLSEWGFGVYRSAVQINM